MLMVMDKFVIWQTASSSFKHLVWYLPWYFSYIFNLCDVSLWICSFFLSSLAFCRILHPTKICRMRTCNTHVDNDYEYLTYREKCIFYYLIEVHSIFDFRDKCFNIQYIHIFINIKEENVCFHKFADSTLLYWFL